jgi:hypothetical protein
VVHVVGHVPDELPERVVGELSHVHERVEAPQIVDRQPADVLMQRVRRAINASVQPAVAVEAGVDAHDLVAVSDELRTEQAAQVALTPSEQDAHRLPFVSARRGDGHVDPPQGASAGPTDIEMKTMCNGVINDRNGDGASRSPS